MKARFIFEIENRAQPPETEVMLQFAQLADEIILALAQLLLLFRRCLQPHRTANLNENDFALLRRLSKYLHVRSPRIVELNRLLFPQKAFNGLFVADSIKVKHHGGAHLHACITLDRWEKKLREMRSPVTQCLPFLFARASGLSHDL